MQMAVSIIIFSFLKINVELSGSSCKGLCTRRLENKGSKAQ